MPSESMRELTFLRSDPSWGEPMVFTHRKRLVGVKIAHRFLKAKVLLHRQHAINVEFKFAHLMSIQRPHTSSAQRGGEQTFAVAQVLEEADAGVEVLVGKGQYWGQLLVQGAGAGYVAGLKAPVDRHVNRVHGGGDEGVHAPVQGFEHLRGSPAAADMQGALGGCQHR